MANSQKVGPQGLQATVTAALGGIVTASCLKWIPAEDAQYWAGVASLIVPGIGYLIARFAASLDEPEELTRYKARLKRDLKHQNKMLKDKNVSSTLKEEIREKYSQTMLKLATANQDHDGQRLVEEG